MSEEWHLSKYNLFAKLPNSEQIGCVNLLKGTYAILSLEEAYLLHNNHNYEDFIKKGFIVNYDEQQALEFLARKTCSSSKTLNLTICPTMNCNFNCPYCFEEHRLGRMSKETQNKLLNFIERSVSFINAQKISVTWFGGEPTLAIEVIDYLSKKIIELCNERKIQYNAVIVTNGYLLTQKMVDNFFKNKITDYQITLDGVDELHDKTRHLVNGWPTFERIIQNLSTLKIRGKINIRHNVYNDNIKDIESLKKYVQNLNKISGNNISYYSAIATNNDVALKKENQIDFLKSEEFCFIDLNKKIRKLNSYSAIYCGAQISNFIVIDELGNLYKCWEDAGNIKNSFGTVDKWNINNPIGSADNPQILINYINTGGALKDKECQECIWLPVCQGGCPHRILFYNKSCIPYKDKPEEFVQKFIEFKEKNNK